MKKLLLVIFLLLAPSLANAQASKNDLIGLGMAPELANELVKGTVSNSSYIIQVDNDPQRKFTFDASSDTALTLSFGDGSVTDNQNFYIQSGVTDSAQDDGVLCITGGGTPSDARGSFICSYGNDHPNDGLLSVIAGAEAGSDLHLQAKDDITMFLASDGNRTINFDSSSDTALAMKFGDGSTASQVLAINGTAATHSITLGGGTSTDLTIADNLITVASGTALALANGILTFSSTSTGVASTTAGTVTAAGTTVADATQLGAVWNIVSTVAASTGVKLWDSPNGIQICVQNGGANNLELYPPTSGHTINAAAAGAGITLAAATDDIACCTEVASTQWFCTLDAGPAT